MNRAADSIFNVTRFPVDSRPFPHALVDEIFSATLFRELQSQFPNILAMSSPTGPGNNLYWGDDEYERLLQSSPAWKRVFRYIHSQAFLQLVIEQFDPYWKAEGCTIDLSRACYVPFCEDRTDKELRRMRKAALEPHELWCRLDFYQSMSGYYLPAHLDHRRRLISMLVYFDDQQKTEMDGGELTLHTPWPDLQVLHAVGLYHAPKPFSLVRERLARTKLVSPKANRMAVFLCGKKSWHSVSAIRSARYPRRYVHILISSSVDAWR
jgi:hypothetical protein